MIRKLSALRRTDVVAYRGTIWNQKGKNQGPNSILKKPFMPFFKTDRHYRAGYECYQKGPPRVHWIIGRLHAKHQRPKSRDKKVISF